MDAIDASGSERLFQALGDLLAAEDREYRLVVVGGVALALGGFVRRGTKDVDVIALVEPGEDGALVPSKPLPPELEVAVRRVGRDFGLPADWLNGQVGALRPHELPPTLVQDLSWRTFGTLHIGLAGRRALIALKLFAAADHAPTSKHVSDLVDLAPTQAEWAEAAAWVKKQDAAAEFAGIVEEVIAHVDQRVQRRP